MGMVEDNQGDKHIHVRTGNQVSKETIHLIRPHIGAPFFDFSNVNIGLTSLTTPI